ncbi:DUF1289 domain-containing protein [Hydrogenophaga sp. 2FB]|uniref:DUF1289 domain-containing protein n=1 Tax=Hydrogenophaga sp. 2FB TaxID=2502187 RepID=UPI00207B9F5B|nr:DUF1289 domain-containing protein [Hydrogenophaga sp. 2FB]
MPPAPVTLQAARRRAALAPGVPSPCISICRMNAASGWCEGCYRTLDEIVAWGRASDADKLRIWQDIEARQQPR